MPAELPVRVQPVAGAQIANFPWATAQSALAVVDDTVAALTTQLDQRSTMVSTLTDWVGRFRDEFDSALNDATTTAGGLKETLQSLASSIVSGAESANSAQRTYNAEATRRAQPNPHSNIPI